MRKLLLLSTLALLPCVAHADIITQSFTGVIPYFTGNPDNVFGVGKIFQPTITKIPRSAVKSYMTQTHWPRFLRVALESPAF